MIKSLPNCFQPPVCTGHVYGVACFFLPRTAGIMAGSPPVGSTSAAFGGKGSSSRPRLGPLTRASCVFHQFLCTFLHACIMSCQVMSTHAELCNTMHAKTYMHAPPKHSISLFFSFSIYFVFLLSPLMLMDPTLLVRTKDPTPP